MFCDSIVTGGSIYIPTTVYKHRLAHEAVKTSLHCTRIFFKPWAMTDAFIDATHPGNLVATRKCLNGTISTLSKS